MRLLVIDPFSSINTVILSALGQEGFIADRSRGVKRGIWLAKANPYDVILLFIPSLPVLVETARIIYAARPDTYLIALVKPPNVNTRVALLEEGLDEVVCYPCTLRELTVRIRSLLRRIKGTGKPSYCQKIDDLSIDPTGFRVVRGDRENPAPAQGI